MVSKVVCITHTQRNLFFQWVVSFAHEGKIMSLVADKSFRTGDYVTLTVEGRFLFYLFGFIPVWYIESYRLSKH